MVRNPLLTRRAKPISGLGNRPKIPEAGLPACPSVKTPILGTVADQVRRRVLSGGERIWRFEDFRGLPFGAVAQALSRLARAGRVRRVCKGVYSYPSEGKAGRLRSDSVTREVLAAGGTPVFVSGVSAARLLGFATRGAGREEFATCAGSLPRSLVGSAARVHTRRPAAWAGLSEREAALLDFLRGGGGTSQMSAEETIAKTIEVLSEGGCFERLAAVSGSEPPRVRAILGALGERMGASAARVAGLQGSLNPLSRFDLGVFAELPNSAAWQAKQKKRTGVARRERTEFEWLRAKPAPVWRDDQFLLPAQTVRRGRTLQDEPKVTARPSKPAWSVEWD